MAAAAAVRAGQPTTDRTAVHAPPPAPMSASDAPPLTGKLWKASAISDPFTAATKAEIDARAAAGKPAPRLVGILATQSAPSIAYAEFTQRACAAAGINFEIWRTWDDDASAEPSPDPAAATASASAAAAGTDSPPHEHEPREADVEDLIIAANADRSVDGVMVYYPIFGGRRDTYLQQIVDPRKDVEGLHFSYCWNMYHNVRWLKPADVGRAPGTATEVAADGSGRGRGSGDEPPAGFYKSILPCTPLAVVKCLEAMGVYDRALAYGDRLHGKTVTIVNRSEVVGRPLAALLANDGAKVYSVDLDGVLVFTKDAAHADTADTGPSSAHATPKTSARVRQARAQNAARRLRAHHAVRGTALTLADAVPVSDVVIGGVPSDKFKIATALLKPGATCVNFSSEKNFEKDCRARAGQYIPAMGKLTIAMLQRNLLVRPSSPPPPPTPLPLNPVSASVGAGAGSSHPPHPPHTYIAPLAFADCAD